MSEITEALHTVDHDLSLTDANRIFHLCYQHYTNAPQQNAINRELQQGR